MTDVTAEAPTENLVEAPTQRRGRPRPDTTIARDEQVLAAIGAGSPTRAQLAETTGLEPKAIYLSLYRLRVQGRVERVRDGSDHVWRAKASELAPVATG